MKIFNLEIRGVLAIEVILARREKQELFLGWNYTYETSRGGWEGQGLIQEFPFHSFSVVSSSFPQSEQNFRAQGGSGRNFVCEESLQFQHLCSSQGRDVYLLLEEQDNCSPRVN